MIDLTKKLLRSQNKHKPRVKRHKKIKVNCAYCGEEFLTWVCRRKVGAGKFCSRKCLDKGRNFVSWNKGTKGVMKANSGSFKKGQNVGANAYNWKGGRQRNKHGGNTKYREWRTSVFKRDNYTCVWCGERVGNGHRVYLQAHHVFSWADNPEKRFDINNGTTLCLKCHKEFHKKFGMGKNTGHQFLSFIEYYDGKILKEI